MESSNIAGWMVTLAGIVAALVPASTLYLQRADARHRASEAAGNRRRSYERESVRVFDEYVELYQTLLMIDGMSAEDSAIATAMRKTALSKDILKDPARHLYSAEEAPKS